jgi:hypothetical protein
MYLSGCGIKAVTVVLAFIGIIALVALGAMALMHWGMMGGMMDCCR